MSISAADLAGLVDAFTSDMPFSAHTVEQRLGAELERQSSSNDWFTVSYGTVSDTEGVRSVEVREPTMQSIGRGKNGLILLELDDGPTEDELSSVFDEMERAPAPYPDAPQDRVALEVPRPWGLLTIGIDRGSRRARTVLLDTSP